MRKYDYILFDFDGTISQSAEGVRKCIELTLMEMGRGCPDLSDYSKYIGPPLTRTFEKLCGLGREESLEALPIYRKYYDTEGVYENRFFDGVEELLKRLSNDDHKLAVCTSKNERLAVRSMEAIGADGYFDAICGSKDDGSRKEKADLIPYALSALGCEDKSRAALIGDTRFDAEGAKICGIDFIGVLYGYGTESSMRKASACRFAEKPEDVLKYLY